jgi:hypothetical protein
METMTKHRGLFAVLIAGTLLLGALACQDSDKVPPEDSTISMAATPSTILLSNGSQASEITILATVYSGIGVPLPGQDVRFTQTSGDLTPLAGTPVRTDSIGNAVTRLNNARTTTTITAKAGKATATLQLQTATCEIQDIALDPSQITFTACTPTVDGGHFDLTATVTDTSGDPCADIVITFKSTPANPPMEDVGIKFSPGSGSTNSQGQITTSVTLSNECETLCNGMDCNTSMQVIEASGGGITSAAPTTVNINIQ